ncbi:hypothetical protein ACEWY4_002521 [Coilia grayii]|uniref:Scaffolding anchor of CK1 domain-containing protein n=1 Tax=Coilia grayii TaxID=363190 RepID=A0ABD1KNN3_9TELE
MALSQIQCLDDECINLRINESKPEFLYSEEQRVALEILFHDGPEAYEKYLKAQNVRGFLSDCELEHLTRTAVLYNPGGQGESIVNGEVEEIKLPSEYWPERSDHSFSDLDMGWPDITSYRGVTRVTVHTQPPMDGQPHIKEVVRRTINQAQKVIGIVMDLFTDVDIFRDLLDMSYKRRVAVYIILEATGVPHFLRMCERAGMHRGHLKKLRVTCTQGSEFFTRSAKKVSGTINHKFMFVDGDKTVSGSYSFTWSSSRLDRNVITLLTGQAVETFDRLFRDLYFTSRAVNLANLNLAEEPEPETILQSAQQAAVAAAIARKLYSAKYALVSTASLKSNGTCSSKNTSGNMNPLPRFFRQPRVLFEEPRIHPGLVGLEKANMIGYLPTWPEPDPPSDVIGIINIRDSSKPFHAHLMRSELFETSQAIRFKEPFHMPEEELPEKATPRPPFADFLSSMKADQLPGQPLKTKGEEARDADLVEQAPLRQQHDQDSVLPLPIGGPRMAHLNVINGCDSHTTWVKGIKEPQVNSQSFPRKSSPLKAMHAESTKHTDLCEGAESSVFSQGAKDLCSAPDCAVEPEHPCSTASAKASRRKEGTVSNAKRNQTMDPGAGRTNTKSSPNGPRAQLPKDPSPSHDNSHCNGSVPEKSKSNIYVNGHHTHPGTLNGRHVKTEGNHQTQKLPLDNQQKMDKKNIPSTKTKESTILPMPHGESCHASNDHMVSREDKAGVDGRKAALPPVNQQTSQEKTTKELSQIYTRSKPQKVGSIENILNQQNGIKEPMSTPTSEHKQDRNRTASIGSQTSTSSNKIHASSTKEGESTHQHKDWIPEETLFISEEGDDPKEMNGVVQNKPRGLIKKPVQAQDMKDKLSDSTPTSKRDQKTKVEGKHTGPLNPKVEPTAHPTLRSEAEKQVEKKGYPWLLPGVSTSNLSASKLKGETGGQLRDKAEKPHYRSTQDIVKQLKAESKPVTRPLPARREGSQTPTLRNKATQGQDDDLQVRTPQEQTRTKIENDGKKIFRAPPTPTSRTQPASRPEGAAKGPGAKSDPIPSTAKTTTPAKTTPKYFQGKVFSSAKTKQVSALPPDHAASSSINPSSSMLSLNGPALTDQMASRTNSPLGQSMPSLEKSKSGSSTPKPSISFPKLSQLRSLKERITRSPSQKSLTGAKKGAA